MKLIHSNLLNSFWKKGIVPIKTEIEEKIAKSKIVNNLLTTKAGYVLDARQGKVLQDQVAEINSKLSDVTDKIFVPTSLMPYGGYEIFADSYIHISDFGQVDLYAKINCTIVQGTWHTVALLPQGVRPNVHRRMAAYIVNDDASLTPVACYIYNSGSVNIFTTLPTGQYTVEIFGSYIASRE